MDNLVDKPAGRRAAQAPDGLGGGREGSREPGREEGGARWRSIFVSDIHLGTAGCKAEFLLDFLRHNECDTLYLVGDIVDGWRLKRGWYWPQSHNDVVQKVLRKARKGTEVIYVPGNHDEMLRDYLDHHFGGIFVVGEAVHVAADGKRFLVIHGDAFDGVVRYARWLAFLGDHAYSIALWSNEWFNRARRAFGLPYWSLSAWLKNKVKNAVKYISDFEEAVAAEARRRGFDGVICGHIHKAEIRAIDGIVYMNDGDWVESCTALAEDRDGNFRVIDWAHARGFDMLAAPAKAVSAKPVPAKAAAQ